MELAVLFPNQFTFISGLSTFGFGEIYILSTLPHLKWNFCNIFYLYNDLSSVHIQSFYENIVSLILIQFSRVKEQTMNVDVSTFFP